MGSLYKEVTSVLADYFDGLHHSDTSRLSKVFHPMAHYICAPMVLSNISAWTNTFRL